MTGRFAFVHIGKSGGTSLVTMLREAFPSERVCPAIFLNEFTETEGWADDIRYDLWCGHMGFSHAQKVSPNIFTVLRNPIDRILSLYYYWRSVESATEGPLLAKRYSLEEFVDSDAISVIVDVRNTQTWQLAADHSIETRQRMSNLSEDDLLSLAKGNLDSMAFVGYAERFDEASSAIMKLVGAPYNGSVRVNVTPNRVSMNDITLTQRRLISRRCEIDMALYDYVVSRPFSQITSEG